MEKKPKRPKIPESVKRELLIKAAGRCEFKGCNKYLYRDGVTKQPRNLINYSHIVSWIPSGPRGNEDSEKLATDISNLMLLCSEHNNLIDDCNYVDQYPVELLQQYKREHEERIAKVTGMGQDYGIRIIKMYSKIQGQVPNISDKSIGEAIAPYYPLDDPVIIDLTQIENIEEAKTVIKRIVDLHIISVKEEESYGVFIMSKIAYSCYLGYLLGNKVKAEVFQFFRDTQDWKWRDRISCSFDIIKPEKEKAMSQINLLVEVSGEIDRDLIPSNLCYSIRAQNPGFSYLQSKEQLLEFRVKFRELLDAIRVVHKETVIINLIVATPNPINFEIGKSIMKNIDPTIVLFDKIDKEIAYQPVTILHERIRKQ